MREKKVQNKKKYDPGHKYQPDINTKSKALANRKQLTMNKNVTDRLYEDAKSKQLRLNMMSSDATSQ